MTRTRERCRLLVADGSERSGYLRCALTVQRHHRTAHQGMHTSRDTVCRAGIGRRDIGGVPAVLEAIVQRRPVGIDDVGTLDIPRASVQMS